MQKIRPSIALGAPSWVMGADWVVLICQIGHAIRSKNAITYRFAVRSRQVYRKSGPSYRIRNASLYPDATNPMQMIRPFNNFGCSIRGYGCRLDCIDLLNVDMQYGKL
ncbi:hypothetical protein CEXT_806671 [Caerostris extrusa]|uniref:Uncharacterized protein n=1 Tax=Caerostris extrusa TaxID=172846 RepID=A0AAV4M7N9_CAEEX|nr:hypothetical protein CEXT_806671 [Caerostris extrusa]